MINLNEEDFMQAWRAKIENGVFALPVCGQCEHVIYPLGETCPSCLSDDLHWRDVESGGCVLATTQLHHSLDERFQNQLPWPLATVQLDIGPVSYVKADSRLVPGDRVQLQLTVDGEEPGLLPYFVASKGAENR